MTNITRFVDLLAKAVDPSSDGGWHISPSEASALRDHNPYVPPTLVERAVTVINSKPDGGPLFSPTDLDSLRRDFPSLAEDFIREMRDFCRWSGQARIFVEGGGEVSCQDVLQEIVSIAGGLGLAVAADTIVATSRQVKGGLQGVCDIVRSESFRGFVANMKGLYPPSSGWARLDLAKLLQIYEDPDLRWTFLVNTFAATASWLKSDLKIDVFDDPKIALVIKYKVYDNGGGTKIFLNATQDMLGIAFKVSRCGKQSYFVKAIEVMRWEPRIIPALEFVTRRFPRLSIDLDSAQTIAWLSNGEAMGILSSRHAKDVYQGIFRRGVAGCVPLSLFIDIVNLDRIAPDLRDDRFFRRCLAADRVLSPADGLSARDYVGYLFAGPGLHDWVLSTEGRRDVDTLRILGVKNLASDQLGLIWAKRSLLGDDEFKKFCIYVRDNILNTNEITIEDLKKIMEIYPQRAVVMSSNFSELWRIILEDCNEPKIYSDMLPQVVRLANTLDLRGIVEVGRSLGYPFGPNDLVFMDAVARGPDLRRLLGDRPALVREARAIIQRSRGQDRRDADSVGISFSRGSTEPEDMDSLSLLRTVVLYRALSGDSALRAGIDGIIYQDLSDDTREYGGVVRFSNGKVKFEEVESEHLLDTMYAARSGDISNRLNGGAWAFHLHATDRRVEKPGLEGPSGDPRSETWGDWSVARKYGYTEIVITPIGGMQFNVNMYYIDRRNGKPVHFDLGRF